MLVPESDVLAQPSRQSSQSQSRRAKIMPVVRVAAGNALEMYDFQIFGYYATAIAATFFPTGHEFASLMLALATFGAGFLMRPLGAIVLGAYIDHRGRRAGLLLTLALMGFGTLAVACLPGYAVLGIAAPLLILVGRLVQGFSAGVELGGVSVYLSEIAPPNRKGFYVSWQSASQQVAVMFAALLGIALTSTLSHSQMTRWGWQIGHASGWLRAAPLVAFPAPLAGRNRRIPGASAASQRNRHREIPLCELAAGGARHDDVDHDHGVLLSGHRVHAHFRQHHPSSCCHGKYSS